MAPVLQGCTKPNQPAPEEAAEYQTLRGWLARQGIPAPVEGPPAPEAASKAAHGRRLLGDATGDGRITFWDLWPLWQYLTGKTYMAEHYDFDLLDIDRDGDNDWDDLKYLGRFLYVAGSGNPWNIGEPLAPPIMAALSPPPSGLDLVADGTLWQRLTLSVTTRDGAASPVEVRVRVNPEDAGTPVLEIARRTTAPAGDWCAGEPNDTKTGRHGQVFWLAGCRAGGGAVQILDGDDSLLASYPVTVRPNTSDDRFNIDLVFVDPAFTEHQKSLIRQAADRWESVITEDLGDVDFQQQPFDWHQDGPGWGYFDDPVPVTDTVDDLRVFVGRLPEGSEYGGMASPILGRPDDHGKPVLAQMFFNRHMLYQAEDTYQWQLRHPDYVILLKGPEEGLVNLALHEIGHCLGIGVGWTRELGGGVAGSAWDALTFGTPSSRHFAGPLAIQAFNEAGGDSYAGEKVPIDPDGAHWRDSVFTNSWILMQPGWRAEDIVSELMSQLGTVVSGAPPGSPLTYRGEGLSAITIAALADMGYRVDFSQADPYRLPGPALAAGKRVAAGWPPLACGVGHEHR